MDHFDSTKDNDDVFIDFARSSVAYHSGLGGIDSLAKRYLSEGKTLHLLLLCEDYRRLLTRGGGLVEVYVSANGSQETSQ
jgi:SulP family sulfate permease